MGNRLNRILETHHFWEQAEVKSTSLDGFVDMNFEVLIAKNSGVG